MLVLLYTILYVLMCFNDREGNKTSLFCDTSTYPGVVRCESDITKVLGQIHDHRKEIRRILRKPTLEYVTVSGLEVCIKL